jgi:hypothetical protein
MKKILFITLLLSLLVLASCTNTKYGCDYNRGKAPKFNK